MNHRLWTRVCSSAPSQCARVRARVHSVPVTRNSSSSSSISSCPFLLFLLFRFLSSLSPLPFLFFVLSALYSFLCICFFLSFFPFHSSKSNSLFSFSCSCSLFIFSLVFFFVQIAFTSLQTCIFSTFSSFAISLSLTLPLRSFCFFFHE